ncbi:MAG: hypothetical protein AVDCRST_MAG19-2245 [uncultured Thermomicrobiales bacterium]|uniref:Uncharacterized protein n=1 Tax=uncultured Thermomicrobiales bacterium TaxID=1645740 RepID=A0A6J4V0F0_9BACT|nr:MAG: hypothetical protein AVDCRST_MAG19-2245 [uncultured Thermomicrobiales bacterium]
MEGIHTDLVAQFSAPLPARNRQAHHKRRCPESKPIPPRLAPPVIRRPNHISFPEAVRPSPSRKR